VRNCVDLDEEKVTRDDVGPAVPEDCDPLPIRIRSNLEVNVVDKVIPRPGIAHDLYVRRQGIVPQNFNENLVK
jgi:hypothetical protein